MGLRVDTACSRGWGSGPAGGVQESGQSRASTSPLLRRGPGWQPLEGGALPYSLSPFPALPPAQKWGPLHLCLAQRMGVFPASDHRCTHPISGAPGDKTTVVPVDNLLVLLLPDRQTDGMDRGSGGGGGAAVICSFPEEENEFSRTKAAPGRPALIGAVGRGDNYGFSAGCQGAI